MPPQPTPGPWTTQLTKTEAFAQGRFERVEFNTVASTRNGKVWLQGFVTYRRYPYEAPITEDFQAELEPRLLAAARRMLEVLTRIASETPCEHMERSFSPIAAARQVLATLRDLHGEGQR